MVLYSHKFVFIMTIRCFSEKDSFDKPKIFAKFSIPLIMFSTSYNSSESDALIYLVMLPVDQIKSDIGSTSTFEVSKKFLILDKSLADSPEKDARLRLVSTMMVSTSNSLAASKGISINSGRLGGLRGVKMKGPPSLTSTTETLTLSLMF